MNNTIVFDCKRRINGEFQHWEATMTLTRRDGEHIELQIEGRGGSFDTVTGPKNGGHYLAVTNWSWGCELAGYKDIDWNYPRILNAIENAVDATTICTALTHVPDLLAAIDKVR